MASYIGVHLCAPTPLKYSLSAATGWACTWAQEQQQPHLLGWRDPQVWTAATRRKYLPYPGDCSLHILNTQHLHQLLSVLPCISPSSILYLAFKKHELLLLLQMELESLIQMKLTVFDLRGLFFTLEFEILMNASLLSCHLILK